jgi:hypothetical protein
VGLVVIPVQVGWLQDLTNWLRGLVQKLWDAIEQFFTDLIILAIEKVLELIALAFEQLPAPEFMTQHSIGSLLGNAGPAVGWFVQTFKISEAMGFFAVAAVFRISRKILTFGKW